VLLKTTADLQSSLPEGQVSGTFPTLMFGHVADAEIARMRSDGASAAQRIFRVRTLQKVEIGKI